MNEKTYPADWRLFLVTLVLLSFGVVMVYDASYAHAIETQGDGIFFFKRQLGSAILGLGLMFGAARIRFWKWQAAAVPLMGLGILMLIAVRIPHIGHGAQGADRWIGYGPIRLQPSEFTKLGVILYLAKVLSARPKSLTDFWHGVAPVVSATLFAIFLVARQPDLGTASTILLTMLVVLFAAGVKPAWVAAILAVCILGGAGMVVMSGKKGNFQVQRLRTFIDPQADQLGSGYQIIHSTIALGTGGPTGLGFGESREKRQGNLPAQRTDFIYAIIGEEFGLAGTLGVIVLFLLLGARGLHIAQRTKDPFGALLAIGITSMIWVQALINIAVVTASIPATGVPLPFISYGGSSLVLTLMSVGILLNISQHPYRVDPRPSARRVREEEREEYTGSRARTERLGKVRA